MAIGDLEALANAIPALNQQAAQQQQAAQKIQARGAVAQAPSAISSGQVAQAVATPQAQQQNAIAGQAQQATAQQQLGLAGQQAERESTQRQQQLQRNDLANQQDLFNRGQTLESDLANQQMSIQRDLTAKELRQAQDMSAYGIDQDNKILQTTLDMRRTLRQLGDGFEDQLLDSRRRFQNDELGRNFSNQRQLADYAAASAQNDQDLAAKLRTIQAANQQNELLLDALNAKIQDELKAQVALGEQSKDSALMQKLAAAKSSTQKAIERQKAQSAANGAIIQAIFTVGGAAIGGAGAGPGGAAAGAAAGAGIGQGLGTAAAGASNK